MKKIGIVGKRYEDVKLYTERNQIGESNNCLIHEESLGGMYNFRSTEKENFDLIMMESGIKKAYIVEDKTMSTRTSYTYTSKPSIIDNSLTEKLNCLDWVHFAYLDDLEDIENIKKITKPYSIDFCMNKDRLSYSCYIDAASIVFDSRERKSLYDSINTDTPIIFHDEKGCEVVIDGKIICEHFCETLKNISVNGAGDIFAKYFLKKHFIENDRIENASQYALQNATLFLKLRSINK